MIQVSKIRNTYNIFFVISICYITKIKICTAVTITEPPPKALKKLFYEELTEITAAANFETELEPLDNLGRYNLYYLIQFINYNIMSYPGSYYNL